MGSSYRTIFSTKPARASTPKPMRKYRQLI